MQLARDIFVEVRSTRQEATQKWIDQLCEVVGNERFTQLLTEVAPKLDGYRQSGVVTKIFQYLQEQ